MRIDLSSAGTYIYKAGSISIENHANIKSPRAALAMPVGDLII